MIDTLLLAAGALVALASLPGTLELAMLTFAGLLPARRPSAAAGAGEKLKVVAVVPAHDEEGGIARCIASLQACEQESDRYEIAVIADNCSDDTATRAREAGARVLQRFDQEKIGKGHALEWAFAQLIEDGADVLMVIDADTVVESNLVASMRARFGAGADAVQSRYGVLNASESLRTRLMNVALLAFNVLRPRGRDRLGLSVGILGNGFALSRETLLAVPYDAHSVVEDLEYHLSLVRSGRRVQFADETTVRADMPVGGRGVDTQRARWEGGRFRMIRETVPLLSGEVLRGQTRLLEPLFELLLLPLAFHVVLLMAALVIPSLPSQLYALLGLAVVGIHVCAGIVVGGGGPRDVLALFAAPFYVVWKLGLSRAIARASRRETDWVRTERASATGDRP